MSAQIRGLSAPSAGKFRYVEFVANSLKPELTKPASSKVLGDISQKRQKFRRMQEIGDGRGRSSERPGDRFRAVAFYSPVPNDFLFTRRERPQRAHHGVDGKPAGIPKSLPIAHGGGGNADYFGRAFVPETFLKAVDGRLPLFGR